jgi:NHL repeat/WD40-like Beta Propeller Repeat
MIRSVGPVRRSFIGMVAAVALLAFAPPASAARNVAATFGHEGTDAGGFEWAGGIAVNQTTGDVYVADVPQVAGGNRIEQFSADGDFIRAWGWGTATGADAFEICTTSCQAGIAGSGDGQFSFQFQNSTTDPQIAIDQGDGSVYVADTLNDRVQKFSASGAFLDAFGTSGGGVGELTQPQGVTVAPVSGDVYVSDAANRVQRFSSSGLFEAEIGLGGGSEEAQFNAPARLAADSTGRLYVLDRDNGRVQRFLSDGTFDLVFAAGLVSNPVDVEVDQATDHVYVIGSSPDFSVNGVFEFDAAGTGIETHAANSGVSVSFLGGIAVSSSAGRLYASDQIGRRVLILDEVAPPVVSIEPPQDVTANSATFRGTVNPAGPPNTSYRYEYSTDGSSWVCVPNPSCSANGDPDVGIGTEDVEVPQTVSDLEAATEYHVRLVATRDFNAAVATSTEITFQTDAAPPVVRPLAAGTPTDTAVWLGGRVNPQNSQTSAYIEYTVEDDVNFDDGLRVPLAPESIDVGDGNQDVTVMRLVTGLKAGETYRFRVVGTNVAGTTEGPAQTFTTAKAVPSAPPGRGYELVSPQDKNGAEIDRNVPAGPYSTSGASVDGNIVAFAARGQFAGIDSGVSQGQYRSVRDGNGWTTRGISPPVTAYPATEAVTTPIWFLSEDLSRAVVTTNALLAPAANLLGGSWGLYLQDNSGVDATYRLLSEPESPLPAEAPEGQSDRVLRFSFVAATKDLRHILFESLERQLTADGTPGPQGVYAWTDGELRFVSVLPSGVPAQQGMAGSGTFLGQVAPGAHVMSEDGERIFFVDDSNVYVREHDSTTRVVSASQRDGDDPTTPRPGTFMGASEDGRWALISSVAKLTDDATACDSLCPTGSSPDLYLWDADASVDERLEDLSTGDPRGGGILGMVSTADDLSRAYFVATGELTDEATPGSPNLYEWSAADGLRHVAALSAQDQNVWTTNRNPGNEARLSADGTRLLFASRAQLTAAADGGHKQVYLYDALSGELECVSCADGADTATGDAWLFFPPVPGLDVRTPYRLPRNLTPDGKRVFFETAQALVDNDTNGKPDVYMWADGDLSLISTGKAEGGSQFIDSSASGNDVFFTTRERLVGADADNLVDVYDARVGGGLPEQQQPVPCVGDRCQPDPTPKPELRDPASDTVIGDPPAPVRASVRVKGLSAEARKALARGRKTALVVRVNKAGRIAVQGTARIGKQSRTVLKATKRARSAGTAKLPLQLSKAGRRQLARTGRLRVALTVRFSGVREPERLSLALVRASKSGRGR